MPQLIKTASNTQWLQSSSGAGWATVKEGGGTVSLQSGSDHLRARSFISLATETFLRFDLSEIPERALIQSAVLTLDIETEFNSAGFWSLQGYTVDYGASLSGADWLKASVSSVQTALFQAFNNVFSAGATHDFDITSPELITKDGNFDIAILEGSLANDDVAATTPESGVHIYAATAAGRTDPTLTVDYITGGMELGFVF